MPAYDSSGVQPSASSFARISFISHCINRLVIAYSCRRAKELEIELKKLSRRSPTDIVFDSSGVKIYGEGEWKVRQHGKAKRRTWRKIHLAICPNSHEVILSELTDRSQTDDAVAKQMTPELPKSVRNAYGDGAYDKQGFYLACYTRGIMPLIPPRKGASLSDQTKKPWMQHRNDALRAIKGLS